MSKKKKENKHQLPVDENGEVVRKPIVSKYFTNVKWLDEMDNGDRIVDLNGLLLSSQTLSTVVTELADSFLIDYTIGWNVTYANAKYFEMCEYELTPVFAVYWLDYYIERVSEALYLLTFKNVFANSEHKDTTKKDKEADKAALEVQTKFLSYIETYNKEKK